MTQKRVQLSIEGMTCVSCARGIERSLKSLSGVLEVYVNFATSQADVVFDADEIPEESLIQAVHKAGYHADIKAESEIPDVKEIEEKRSFQEFLIAALLTAPLLIQMLGGFIGLTGKMPDWLELCLASIVQFWCGRRFYVSSYYALRTGSANMDVLIALGTSAAYFFSLCVLLFNLYSPMYFESSATIITLILLGRWLENLTKGKTSDAIERLLKLRPKSAHLYKEGEWVDVPIEDLKTGDIFMVRPGENMPVDGLVLDGESVIDEALLTGESLPVLKRPESKVFAGTSNHNGVLKVRATQVGLNTVLANMVRLVQQAQNSKAPIQKLADQISEVFVPIVVAISLVTWLGWLLAGATFSVALINAVAVLVIACPCALGLATPTVIMVASGKAAEMGILFKEAGALQQAQKMDVLIFDKTGTLTRGKPVVKEIIPSGSNSSEDVLKIAAALEHNSKHPLAEAIVEAVKSYSIPSEPTTDFQSWPGKGIAANKRGKHYMLGSTRFAEENGITLNSMQIESLEAKGCTVSVVWSEKEVLGYVAIADQLREHSDKAIQILNEMGIYTVMLTGDDKRTASAIAKQVGIKEYYAEVLPENKAAKVQELKAQGKIVGMVGDGVNDAPALAAANVGIAIDTGSDVAIESADIMLVGSDMLGVIRAILLSKEMFRKIRQNLFLAFIYNILAIPLAALGFLNPIIAAAAMAMSSICVTGNALLLHKWEPRDL